MVWHLPGLFAGSCILGFFTCMGIGANDLCNSFGTAYGAKVLNLPQLVVIAFVAESVGSTLMGATVASTVKDDVVNVKKFSNNVSRFMWGMMLALASCVMWLTVATWKNLPVSTTHSIIGSVMGFGLVEYGFKNGVTWASKATKFPYVKGVVPVFISWFASPLLASILSILMYMFLRLTLLRMDPHTVPIRMAMTFAVIVYVTMFTNAFFIIVKGLAARVKWPTARSAWVSALIGLPFAIVAFLIVLALIWRIRRREHDRKAALDRFHQKSIDTDRAAAEEADQILAAGMRNAERNDPYAPSLEQRHADFLVTAMEARTQYMRRMYDEFQDAEFEEMIREEGTRRTTLAKETHASSPLAPMRLTAKYHAEAYNPDVEQGLFRYLQVFTSICVAFAHGANDVANGVGPVGAVYSTSKAGGVIPKKSEIPIWILAVGGIGIGVGLALFGRGLLELMGNDLVQLTPSRGFSAEFATAATVMIASVSGLPVSTTQIITGAVIGIGFCDDPRNAIDWKQCVRIFSGWVLTIIITVSTSALIYLPVHYRVPVEVGPGGRK